MFEPLLTQPELLELTEDVRLTLTLRDSVSDLSLLQIMGGHVAEYVVSDVMPSRVAVIVRCHPFLTLKLEPSMDVPCAEALQRSIGQGVRLFSALSHSPAMCAKALRDGLSIAVHRQEQSVGFTSGFDHKWQLVALERDLRLFGGPRELRRAKAILARPMHELLTAEGLLLELSEIDLVHQELRLFANLDGGRQREINLNDVVSVDTQLLRKKQLLTRLYHQKLERPNWQHAANHHEDHEQLKRRLESYQLLAPPELNAMVEQMFSDEEE